MFTEDRTVGTLCARLVRVPISFAIACALLVACCAPPMYAQLAKKAQNSAVHEPATKTTDWDKIKLQVRPFIFRRDTTNGGTQYPHEDLPFSKNIRLGYIKPGTSSSALVTRITNEDLPCGKRIMRR